MRTIVLITRKNKLFVPLVLMVLLGGLAVFVNRDVERIATAAAGPGTPLLPNNLTQGFKTPVLPPPDIRNSNQLAALATNAHNTFSIKNHRDTVLKGKNGIALFVPKNCFATNGPASNVNIEMKEYTTAADFFFSGLTTTSNGRLLQSGGTVYINATSNGKNVKLKDGKNITVAFPTAKPTPNMQTFYGEKNAAGSINWQPTGSYSAQTMPFTNVNMYKLKAVTRTDFKQLPSTLTKSNYQLQLMGNNSYTRAIDTLGSKLLLKAFDEGFEIPKADAALLKGSYVSFTYHVNAKGQIEDIKPTMAILPNDTYDGQDAKRAWQRVKVNFTKTLKTVTGLKPTVGRNRSCTGSSSYTWKQTLRLYIDNVEVCEGDSAIQIGSMQPYEYVENVMIYDDVKADSLKKADARHYFLKAEKLGWINADKFVDNVAKTDVLIDVIARPGVEVKVIFKSMLSVMDAQQTANNKGFVVMNVPTGMDAKILVMENRKDGLYFAVKDVNTAEASASGFSFKPMTMQAIKQTLDEL